VKIRQILVLLELILGQEFCQNAKKIRTAKLFFDFARIFQTKKMEFRNNFLDQKIEKAEKIDFHERQSHLQPQRC